MSFNLQSHEFQLALSCSALDKKWSTSILEKAKCVSSFNENIFLDILKRHQLQELAHQTLVGDSFFSKLFQAEVKKQTDLNQLKSIKGLAVQVKLQEYFNANRIDAIFLKGIFVSHLYYGDIAKRNLVDIDVWIPGHFFRDVKNHLGALGYESILDQSNWNDKQLGFIKLCSHHEIFINKVDPIAPVIELHWKLRNVLGNFMFNPFEEQDKLIKVELSEVQFSVFNHVDQFIFLCVHGAEHGWFKIKWLVDLYHLVHSVDLEWSRIIIRAKELRSIIEVRLACRLLKEFYGLKLADENLLGSFTLADNIRIRYIKHLMAYDGVFCDNQTEKLLNVIYTISLSRKFFIPKALILKNLTNTTDWITLPLPKQLFFLYFLLRPFLWIYRKIKTKYF